jgi:hypothetical protein
MLEVERLWKDDGQEAAALAGHGVRHDGIEELQTECCSQFLYHYRGKWIRLTGMD